MERAFIDAFCGPANQLSVEAARMAGYSSPENGYMIRAKPHIAREIDRRMSKAAERAILTEAWVIERLMRVADTPRQLARFKKVDEKGRLYWDFTGATEEDMQYIGTLQVEEYKEGRGPGASEIVRYKIQERDVMKALELLGKKLGMFKETLELTTDKDLTRYLEEGRKRFKDRSRWTDAEFEEAKSLPPPEKSDEA